MACPAFHFDSPDTIPTTLISHKHFPLPESLKKWKSRGDNLLFLKNLLPYRLVLSIGSLLTFLLVYFLPAYTHILILIPILSIISLLIPPLLATYNIIPSAHNQYLVPARTTAIIPGDFVVFIIGARSNAPVINAEFQAIGEIMLSQLELLQKEGDKLGFLGGDAYISLEPTKALPILIQYWRSMDQLHAFANNPKYSHFRMTRSFYTKDSTVGIFHEAYQIRAGEYDAIYINMPFFGLAEAAGRAGGMLVESGGILKTASQRLKWWNAQKELQKEGKGKEETKSVKIIE